MTMKNLMQQRVNDIDLQVFLNDHTLSHKWYRA